MAARERIEQEQAPEAAAEVARPPEINGALTPETVLALQRTAGNQSVTNLLSRRELPWPMISASPRDWTNVDRENNTQRWKDACLANLNAVDSSQYERVVERRDFYKWFYEATAARGYHTRWALAASLVANGAHQIADMDVDHEIANDTLDLASVELQGAMREGNQVIFDNVLPKLKQLWDHGPLKGRAALEMDMQILSEEQMLIQPMYSRMSKQALAQMDYIARKKRFAGIGAWWTEEDRVPQGPYNNKGTVPEFGGGSLMNVDDRWTYGMKLGDQFTPGGTGFDPARDKRPDVAQGYKDGSELAKIDTKAHLHELDAWLNPHRLSRTGAGSDVKGIVGGLSEPEKARVLTDRSADGFSYAIQFAQFIGVDEATVRAALPAKGDPAAIQAFMGRFKTERAKVEAQFQQLQYQMMTPM